MYDPDGAIRYPIKNLRVRKKSGVRLGQPFVSDFTPRTGRAPVIYAVTLVDHPGVVKIGRTMHWSSRRVAYANWNLRSGDGIANEAVYLLTEEYVDLPRLERDILALTPFPLRHGAEWFDADFESICAHIDQFITSTGFSFEVSFAPSNK